MRLERVVRGLRSLVLALVVVSALAATDVGSAGPAGAQAADDDRSAAQQLAERFAPYVAVRDQPRDCGPGEPFAPASVESVLGRDDVSLVGPDGRVVTTAPTATDLFGLGDGYYLDLPGNPLDAGCTYERWWNSMAADFPPTVHARVATDPEHPGKLVVQYWLWWVFNDWNDEHEGDWEMAQLVFDADSPEQALTMEPDQVVFAQHEGGEFQGWSEDGVQRDGDRVVVFSGAGSHASYFSSDRWFGKSAATGFGCDDTRAKVTRLDPQVVLLPSSVDEVTSAEDPFAWVTFTGRWGEKRPSFDNGPQGPATKASWAGPVSWIEDDGRPGAVSLPPLGSQVTDAFCWVSEEGSQLYNRTLDSPVTVAVVAVVVVALLVVGVRRTRWRPSDTLPVRTPRRAGQLLTAALRLQRHHPATFGPLGLVLLAGGVLATGAQWLVLELTPFGPVSAMADDHAHWGAPLAFVAGAVVAVPCAAVVRAGAAVAVHELAEGRRPTFARVARRAISPAGGLLASIVLHVLVSVATLVPVLVPPVLWLTARWGVATPEGVSRGLGLRGALGASAGATKGHRWRTLGVVVVAHLTAVVVGPLLGTVLLVATDAGFELVNLVSAVVGMVTVPWAGTVVALLREDLVARATPEPEDVVSVSVV